MLEHMGYIGMLLILAIICFSQFAKIMNDRANAQLERTDLSEQQRRAIRYRRLRNLGVMLVYAVAWMASVVIALSGGDFIVALLLTAIAIGLIIYVALTGDTDAEQSAAFKFLAVVLGTAFGFVIGLRLGWTWGTYLLGILLAASFAIAVHFLSKVNVDDLKEVVHPTEPPSAPPAQPQAGIYYQPPARTEPQPQPNQADIQSPQRHRRSDRHDDNGNGEYERRNMTWLVDQLSQTEDGRRELARILRDQQ